MSQPANVYDQAHRLAHSLQSSREYADYRLAAARLGAEKGAREMLRDYRRRQFELQSRLMQGQEVSPADQERFAKLSDLVGSHAIITEFLRAEYGLSRLLADIQKIIAGAVEAVDLGDAEDPEDPEDSEEAQQGHTGEEPDRAPGGG